MVTEVEQLMEDPRGSVGAVHAALVAGLKVDMEVESMEEVAEWPGAVALWRNETPSGAGTAPKAAKEVRRCRGWS